MKAKSKMAPSSVWTAIMVAACCGRVQCLNDFMLPCVFPEEKSENHDLRRLLPLKNLTFTVRDGETLFNESYNYTIGMCRNVGSVGDTAAVVQRRMDGGMRPEVVLGRYTDSFITSGSNWMLLEFRSGDKYPHACNSSNRNVKIMFMCNDAVNDFSHVTIVDNNSDLRSNCYYLFEVQHCGACDNGCVSYHRPISTNTLSLGIIIMISVLSVVAASLVIGLLAYAMHWKRRRTETKA